MNSLNKSQARAYMKARYPEARFSKSAGYWVIPGSSWGMTEAEAESAASAEVELWKDGKAICPAWYQ